MNPVARHSRALAALTGGLLILTGTPATAAPSRDPGPVPSAGPATAGTAAARLSAEPEPAPEPVRPGPAVQEIALASAAGASPTGRSLGAPGTARSEAAAGALAVPQRATEPFSLLGATWTDPAAALGRTIEVRTRSVEGTWTGWQELESDGRSPADPGSADGAGRGRTDPLWVGTSDGVQARVTTDGDATLPAGLRLVLINPDQPAAAARSTAARSTAARSTAAAPRAAEVDVPARPVPKMITRSGWGANEAIVEHAPEYTTDVQVMFVHHTAGTNDYSCADSARIIRGIQGYHVRGNGWNDIGYNFLVDKCGTLFEGRKGGVHRAVLGAHTMGFNSRSSAVAVLGNYNGRTVPAVVRTAIAQVTAYKLGAYGHLATARTTLRSSGSDRYPAGTVVTLNRLSGHRDTGRTECPGDALYGQLGTLRALAGAGPANLRLAGMTGAVASAGAYHTRGLISPLWDTSTPSGLLHRFDVYVDGKLAASAPNTHRRVSLRLAAGSHTLLVRAIHLSGRTASLTRTVVVDAAAPRFAKGPSVVLRTGSLNGSVPVRLGWSATDAGGGLRSVTMTSPIAVNLGVTANGWNGVARPAAATTWSLRAADRAGNATTGSVTRTPVVLSEATATRTGPWTALRNSAYLSGGALRSTAGGASMSWTFTGRSASLAVSRTAVSGRATVYVDGAAAGTIDLRAAATQNRQAVWAKNWGTTGTHTVRVVVAGTSGRPGVILDGLVVLR